MHHLKRFGHAIAASAVISLFISQALATPAYAQQQPQTDQSTNDSAQQNASPPTTSPAPVAIQPRAAETIDKAAKALAPEAKPAVPPATGRTAPTDIKQVGKEPSKPVTIDPQQKAEPERSLKVPASIAPSVPVKPSLTVSSWAGAYGEAQDEAIIVPLARDLGIDIERRARSGDTRDLSKSDVLELDQSSLMAACKSGAVVKFKGAVMQPEDFFANSVSDCGIPTFAWSSILIANGEAMKKLAKSRYRQPTQLEHLLDVKRYPGMRALIRSPKRLLEMMMLGSGVKHEDVYRELATRQGQDKAFEQLDALSSQILWVDGPREALVALDQGKVTIAMTYSGRAFRRLISSQLQPIWDGHIIDFASWAVPAASKKQTEALRFIKAATSSEHLAAQARIWPYGPMRRSALLLAKRHKMLGTDLDEFMPTSELRFKQGLVLNAAFWSEHGAELQDRFDAWLNGVPLGIRVPLPQRAPPPPLPPPPTIAPATQ